MRSLALFPLLLAALCIGFGQTKAGKLHEYLTTVVVTLGPEPTPAPAVLDERALTTAGVLTTAKPFPLSVVTLTKTVAVDNPLPTLVYYCSQMYRICQNTAQAFANDPNAHMTWLYDNDPTFGIKRRRPAACGPVGTYCRDRYNCDTRIQDPMDWRMSCDEAPPAAFLNGGLGASTICASFHEQNAQGSLLGLIPNLTSGDGQPYSESYLRDRVYPVAIQLDYSSHPRNAYGAVIAGGARFAGGVARKEVTGAVQGSTVAKAGSFNTYSTKTAVGWGFGKSYICQPTQSSCSNSRIAEFEHEEYLQPSDIAPRPTPAPTVTRAVVVAAAAASTTSKSKSPRDRSRDKAKQAQDDIEKVRDADRIIEGDSQFAQNVRNAAAAAAAAAILAGNRALDLAYSNGDSDTTRQEVYDAANSALQADAALKTINNPQIQSLYSAISSAAVDASSVANIASTYLPSPTTPASQSNDGGYQNSNDLGGGGGDDGPGSPACILPGSTRVLGWSTPDGSIRSCYNQYNVRSSSGSNGRLVLSYTGDKDSGNVGFSKDTSTGCDGVYIFGGDDSPGTQWAPFCSSSSNGQVVPYLGSSKLVSGLALINNIPLLAIGAKSQSALDCYAKKIVRGTFVSNSVYTISTASSCRVADVQVPRIPIAALFNLSIPIPGEDTMTVAAPIAATNSTWTRLSATKTSHVSGSTI
ncbi:hypothetical protein OC835_006856 [Tilletia horrida]|nr:hypothetical protein OC835_006856 [Tilletia horrida]